MLSPAGRAGGIALGILAAGAGLAMGVAHAGGGGRDSKCAAAAGAPCPSASGVPADTGWTVVVTAPSPAAEPTYCSLIGWYERRSTVIRFHDVDAGVRMRLVARDATSSISRTIVFRGE